MQTGLSIENHFFRWINLVTTQQKRNTEKLIEKTRPAGARGRVSVALRGRERGWQKLCSEPLQNVLRQHIQRLAVRHIAKYPKNRNGVAPPCCTTCTTCTTCTACTVCGGVPCYVFLAI